MLSVIAATRYKGNVEHHKAFAEPEELLTAPSRVHSQYYERRDKHNSCVKSNTKPIQ